jgi:Zn-dependent oligopeptidase
MFYRAKPDSGPWKLDLSDRTFHTIMTYSGNRPLRKLMFEAYYGRASPTVDRLNRNIESIVEITRKRFDLCFYKIYFIFILLFRKLISKFLGYSCFADIILQKSNKPKEYEQLQAWDIAYWRHRQCQDLYSSLKIDPLQISRHFSYDHVLKGLFNFVELLFGIKFELENNFDEQYKWHTDVQIYRCIENGKW